MTATADLGFVPDAPAPGLGFIPDKPTSHVDLGFVPDKNPGGLSDPELQRVLALVPHAAKPAPDDLLLPDIQRDNARQVALDQPFAAVGPGGKIFQETPQNNPEANAAEFAKLWQAPSDVARAGLTDAVTTTLLPATYPLYGVQGVAGMEASLPSALKNAFRNTETNPNPEPLPVDVENAQMSGEYPILATISKVGQIAAGALPLAVTGGAPAWAGRLMSLGFTAQMIADAGPAARTLGTELGKNPEDRDNDQMTSAAADLVQDFGLAPFAGLHGTRDIVERYADKPMYAIRQLSDQLQNAPIVRPAETANLNGAVEANESENLPSQAAETPMVEISRDLASAIQEALRGNQIARAVPQTVGQKMLEELRQQAAAAPIDEAATPASEPPRAAQAISPFPEAQQLPGGNLARSLNTTAKRWIAGTAAEIWADRTIAQSRGRMNIGVDPELMAAYVTKGAAILEKGVREFAPWSAEMTRQLGEKSEAWLRQVYEDALKFLQPTNGHTPQTMRSRLAPAVSRNNAEHFWAEAEKPDGPLAQNDLRWLDAWYDRWNQIAGYQNKLATQTRRDLLSAYKQNLIRATLDRAEAEGWNWGYKEEHPGSKYGSVLYVDTPYGQASFHVARPVGDVRTYAGQWDRNPGGSRIALRQVFRSPAVGDLYQEFADGGGVAAAALTKSRPRGERWDVEASGKPPLPVANNKANPIENVKGHPEGNK